MTLRTFTAPDGLPWDVWAVVPTISRSTAAVQPDFVHGWLCFESGERKRRLAGIPEAWESAAEERLHLYWSAATEARPSVRLSDHLPPRGDPP